MKYIRTFEEYLNESTVNEGGDAAQIAAAFDKVADKLEKELKKETDKDSISLYKSDIKRYRSMAAMAKRGDLKAVKRSYRKADTAAQDYVGDYLPKKVAREILDILGFELNESNEIKPINEDHIEDRKEQTEYILVNAGPAGYPDLQNEEFLNSLSDMAINNYYKMLEVIRQYNDSKE